MILHSQFVTVANHICWTRVQCDSTTTTHSSSLDMSCSNCICDRKGATRIRLFGFQGEGSLRWYKFWAKIEQEFFSKSNLTEMNAIWKTFMFQIYIAHEKAYMILKNSSIFVHKEQKTSSFLLFSSILRSFLANIFNFYFSEIEGILEKLLKIRVHLDTGEMNWQRPCFCFRLSILTLNL